MKFGVEIEAYGLDVDEALEFVQGVDPEWEVDEDSSLSSADDGAEFISPVLEGEEGLARVYRFCEYLEEAGVWTDKTCGLHVHVNGLDMKAIEAYNIVTRYQMLEPFFSRMLHPSRAKDCGSSCDLLGGRKLFKIPPFKSVGSVQEDLDHIERAINTCTHSTKLFQGEPHESYNCYDCYSLTVKLDYYKQMREDDLAHRICKYWRQNRYVTVNLLALQRHGTIEFRQHHGAFRPETVTNWIRVLNNFVLVTRSGGYLEADAADEDHPLLGLESESIKEFYRARKKMRREGEIDFKLWA